MPPKKSTNIEYIRMYYEHQYDRLAKQEESRLTITNYALTVSALVFTFGYQGVSGLTIINGLGLPIIIIMANIFAIAYVDRTALLVKIHKDRAMEILKRYAPELQELNEKTVSPKGGLLSSRRKLQKGMHGLLIFTAFIPLAIYLYHTVENIV